MIFITILADIILILIGVSLFIKSLESYREQKSFLALLGLVVSSLWIVFIIFIIIEQLKIYTL